MLIFEKRKLNELKKIAKDLSINHKQKKDSLVTDIVNVLQEYENYKQDNYDKYEKISRLGISGKEGTTFLVKDKSGNEFAMKIFKSTKSRNTLKKEAEFIEAAASISVSPKLIEYNRCYKFIVMEKLDTNLFDLLKKNKGHLTITQQKQIVSILKKLDKIKLFHADPNPLNFMLKEKKMYIIDFGFSKNIDHKLIKKHGTEEC